MQGKLTDNDEYGLVRLFVRVHSPYGARLTYTMYRIHARHRERHLSTFDNEERATAALFDGATWHEAGILYSYLIHGCSNQTRYRVNQRQWLLSGLSASNYMPLPHDRACRRLYLQAPCSRAQHWAGYKLRSAL